MAHCFKCVLIAIVEIPVVRFRVMELSRGSAKFQVDCGVLTPKVARAIEQHCSGELWINLDHMGFLCVDIAQHMAIFVFHRHRNTAAAARNELVTMGSAALLQSH